jgi:LPXTG-site transpeptidase (sortase) family protein
MDKVEFDQLQLWLTGVLVLMSTACIDLEFVNGGVELKHIDSVPEEYIVLASSTSEEYSLEQLDSLVFLNDETESQHFDSIREGHNVLALSNTEKYPPERLQLPAIHVDTPVIEIGWRHVKNSYGQTFSEWEIADHAAGWHKNSALPGQPGNIVISGHNNIRGSVFRNLSQLEIGDEAILWVKEESYTYQVDQVMILPDKNVSYEQRLQNNAWIGAFPDNRLTLVSCWPLNDNTHRVIVVAYLVGE